MCVCIAWNLAQWENTCVPTLCEALTSIPSTKKEKGARGSPTFSSFCLWQSSDIWSGDWFVTMNEMTNNDSCKPTPIKRSRQEKPFVAWEPSWRQACGTYWEGNTHFFGFPCSFTCLMCSFRPAGDTTYPFTREEHYPNNVCPEISSLRVSLGFWENW